MLPVLELYIANQSLFRQPLTVAINSTYTALDILIATSLVILLYRSRSGFKQSDLCTTELIVGLTRYTWQFGHHDKSTGQQMFCPIAISTSKSKTIYFPDIICREHWSVSTCITVYQSLAHSRITEWRGNLFTSLVRRKAIEYSYP